MKFILLALFVATSLAASYGVDVYSALSVDTMVCLCEKGFSNFFIFRAWRSVGKFDTAAPTNYKNAKETGWSTKNLYAYFYPCYSCGKAGGQVSTFWSEVQSNKMELGKVFIADGWKKPDGFCDSAWESISPYVRVLAHGGNDFFDGWMKDEKSAMISCGDGFRPVTFYIEALPEDAD